MSFLKGSMSFVRCNFEPRSNEDPLEILAAHKFGAQKIARADGAEFGFVAGEMFDLDFRHGKTLVDGALFVTTPNYKFLARLPNVGGSRNIAGWRLRL